jgi:hypothetical protein
MFRRPLHFRYLFDEINFQKGIRVEAGNPKLFLLNFKILREYFFLTILFLKKIPKIHLNKNSQQNTSQNLKLCILIINKKMTHITRQNLPPPLRLLSHNDTSSDRRKFLHVPRNINIDYWSVQLHSDKTINLV